MKTFYFAFAVMFTGLFVGCASNPPQRHGNSDLTYSSRESLANKPIELPMNYSRQNFRKIQMAVKFDTDAIDKELSTRLQTEMAKLKRFTIFSVHNRGGVDFFEELSDVDENVKLREADSVRDIDIVLSGTLIPHKGRRNNDFTVRIDYGVECDFNCEDLKTRTVKFAEKVKGTTSRMQQLTVSGRRRGGWDEKYDNQAYLQAALQALQRLANKLGNYYPVGGKITGITRTGDRMTLDKGFEDGIGNEQQCCIFVDDDGVDVPIARATAMPGNYTSNVKIDKWNEENADAEFLIKELRADPKAFLKKNNVYAVGYGLSLPPEWDKK